MTYSGQFCELAGLWDHKCSLGLHNHHVLNKSSLRNCPEALRFCEKHPEFFLATVCGVANIGRIADSKEARSLLMQKREALWGRPFCEEMLEGVQSRLKVRRPELSLDALLSAEEPRQP